MSCKMIRNGHVGMKMLKVDLQGGFPEGTNF